MPFAHLLLEIAPTVEHLRRHDEFARISVGICGRNGIYRLRASNNIVLHRRERYVERAFKSESVLTELSGIERTVRLKIHPHRRIRRDNVIDKDERAVFARTVSYRSSSDSKADRPVIVELRVYAVEIPYTSSVGDIESQFLGLYRSDEVGGPVPLERKNLNWLPVGELIAVRIPWNFIGQLNSVFI